MRVALLSANPPQANPYIGLFRDGLAAAGAEVELLTDPGDDGLPLAARNADLVHLHWLELWGRPAYVSLAGLARGGRPGRGARRLLEPALNAGAVFDWRRRRFLDRFLRALTTYKARGGRVVYTVHNLGQHEGEGAQVESEGLKRLLALADAVHVHNEFMAQALAGSSRLVTIPHGHYAGAYPNQIGRDQARQRLDIPDDSFVYLFLGLIRPYKGLEELLPAFGRLADPGSLLLVAGQSRPRDYAASLAGAAGADGRVRWHPHFVPGDQVQVWMNAADVVVLPYRRVSTSGAALLALSFGKPVIAPALPAFEELLAGNDFLGLLYDPDQPGSLLQALRQARAIDWQACQPQILAWVLQFDWETIGRQLAHLYADLLRPTN
jgi:glycosyltransferase involved in cell wall biosynthesis